MPPPRPLLERYWEKIDVRGPDECWLWVGGYRDKAGYGVITMTFTGTKKVMMRAHCVALWIDTGVYPRLAEHVVCDNPPCCNPAHLRHSSDYENMLTKSRHGRHHNQLKTHCPQGHPYDEIRANGINKAGEPIMTRTCSICRRDQARESWRRNNGYYEQ